jgi:hypothetical protein
MVGNKLPTMIFSIGKTIRLKFESSVVRENAGTFQVAT